MTSDASNMMHSAETVQGSMRNHAGSAAQPTTTTSCQRIGDQLEQRLCEPSSSTSWAQSSADAAPGTSSHVAASNSNGSSATTSSIPAASSRQADGNTVPVMQARSSQDAKLSVKSCLQLGMGVQSLAAVWLWAPLPWAPIPRPRFPSFWR